MKIFLWTSAVTTLRRAVTAAAAREYHNGGSAETQERLNRKAKKIINMPPEKVVEKYPEILPICHYCGSTICHGLEVTSKIHICRDCVEIAAERLDISTKRKRRE